MSNYKNLTELKEFLLLETQRASRSIDKIISLAKTGKIDNNRQNYAANLLALNYNLHRIEGFSRFCMYNEVHEAMGAANYSLQEIKSVSQRSNHPVWFKRAQIKLNLVVEEMMDVMKLQMGVATGNN